MNRFPNLRLSTWLVAAAVAALAPSCGSDDSPSNPGNKQLCQPGSTQPCTGPAACQGGQTCTSDGKSWGSCDCGAAGSGGSGGGAGGTGGADASSGSGGVGGAAGLDGGEDSSAGTDAAGDAAPGDAQPPGPLDDPCPGKAPLVDHIDINCSDQCQATDTAKCAAMTSCDVPLSNPATVTTANDLPFTIRLPANPGLTCACKTGIASQPGSLQYTLWFMLDAGVADQTLWARVDEPWYIVAPYASSYDRCVDDTYNHPKGNWKKGCATLIGSLGVKRWIGVGTNDPNAPSRTLVVRKPWATGTICQDLWQ